MRLLMTAVSNVTHSHTQTTSFRFMSDPGHGWLEVPVSVVRDLGIAEQISPFSYRNGGIAYLEEDCDMQVFVQAMRKKGCHFTIKDVDGDAGYIRSYSSFHAN